MFWKSHSCPNDGLCTLNKCSSLQQQTHYWQWMINVTVVLNEPQPVSCPKIENHSTLKLEKFLLWNPNSHLSLHSRTYALLVLPFSRSCPKG